MLIFTKKNHIVNEMEKRQESTMREGEKNCFTIYLLRDTYLCMCA